MSLQFTSINIWAVLVCIVINMALGALWYSPIFFGNLWLRLIGKKPEDISKSEGGKAMAFSIIPAAVTILGVAALVSMSNASTVIDGLIAGSLASIAFMGMSAFNLVLFENRSVGVTLINVGYAFVALNIAGIVLSLWR